MLPHNCKTPKALPRKQIRVVSNSATVVSNSATVVSNFETVVPNSETVVSNSETNVSNFGTVVSNSETNVSNSAECSARSGAYAAGFGMRVSNPRGRGPKGVAFWLGVWRHRRVVWAWRLISKPPNSRYFAG
jgi:hypothetical protein